MKLFTALLLVIIALVFLIVYWNRLSSYHWILFIAVMAGVVVGFVLKSRDSRSK